MKILSIAILAVAASSPAFASDHWDNCSNADGSVKIEGGQLIVNGDDIVGPKTLGKRVLEKKSETCRLKNSGQTVIAFDNEVTSEKIEYVYMAVKHTAFLVCERGGSGVPANDSCRE